MFSICLTSCKKNALPKDEDLTQNPEFYFKCVVNGIAINLQAGVNNYYMFSSHKYDSLTNIYGYRGDLKQKDCASNCFYGISIQINDCKSSAPNAPMNPDSALYVGSYQFNDGVLAPLYYTANLYSSYNNISASKFNWITSDAITTQTLQQVSKTYKANTTQNITLNINDTSINCSTSHNNSFKIGNPLQANIYAVRDQPLNALKYTFGCNITSGTSSNTFYSYQWDFGDGSPISYLTNPSHAFNSQNYYRTKLTLVTSDGSVTNTCTTYYQVACFTPTVCNANYNAFFTGIPNPNGYSAIKINIIDSQGVEYSSASINQPNDNNFEIISVENYKPNEQGNLTKKLKIKFNAKLINGNNTLTINNGEAVIAVSYR